MTRKVHYFILAALIGFLSFWSCQTSDYNECVYQPDISGHEIQLEVEELHKKLLNVESKDELQTFLKTYPIISAVFLQSRNYPSEEVMVDELFKRFTNPQIAVLDGEIDRVFGDLSTLKSELNSAFSHLRYYYPDVPLPKVQTVATGLMNDLYVSDSLIIIGLDYYLGEGAKYRPINMFNYILRRYASEYIVPSIMLLYGISPTFNVTDVSDNTILAEMVSYGKSFYFAKQMMPCTPDSIMIWYTGEEMAGVRENAAIIWTHFVENELLFETNHEVKRKYIEDRPKTYDIGDKAPGRIGTWLGWQIVQAYMKKQENISLPELMETKEPQAIFNASKYRP
ncbi:gliding motility lipoprotein GldB [Fulvivirga sp. M361]|uniref:gliding motility lipoprotein GldB n=1 Tax=Fulvivirga sp. M361 TaxID=2594266 RepID=UPI00117B06CB|nr:gliding motility lipoprotein GldB [Fulvivirga sp. M361]TRX58723.1 gliding motility lipoprotein GldB [Fulvivirga sp. M361]